MRRFEHVLDSFSWCYEQVMNREGVLHRFYTNFAHWGDRPKPIVPKYVHQIKDKTFKCKQPPHATTLQTVRPIPVDNDNLVAIHGVGEQALEKPRAVGESAQQYFEEVTVKQEDTYPVDPLDHWNYLNESSGLDADTNDVGQSASNEINLNDGADQVEEDTINSSEIDELRDKRDHPKTSEAKVHDKIKKLRCEECGKAFSRKPHLAYHMVSVHKIGDNKFKCGKCLYATTSTAHLKRHIRVVHDNTRNYMNVKSVSLLPQERTI